MHYLHASQWICLNTLKNFKIQYMAPQLQQRWKEPSLVTYTVLIHWNIIYVHINLVCSHIFHTWFCYNGYTLHVYSSSRQEFQIYTKIRYKALDFLSHKHNHMNLKHFCLSWGILVLNSIESALNWVFSSGVYPNTWKHKLILTECNTQYNGYRTRTADTKFSFPRQLVNGDVLCNSFSRCMTDFKVTNGLIWRI